MVPEKSLGTGIGQIWYRKKVSEPVSGKFGTVKSTGIGIVQILGTVTHCDDDRMGIDKKEIHIVLMDFSSYVRVLG